MAVAVTVIVVDQLKKLSSLIRSRTTSFTSVTDRLDREAPIMGIIASYYTRVRKPTYRKIRNKLIAMEKLA